MIKLKDIASMAGVSPATVSNVLNGKKNVSEEVRCNIVSLCKQHGYQDKARRQSRPNTIVFNFSDFDRSFYLNIIKGISECLTENGYDLIVCNANTSVKYMKRAHSAGAISLDGKMDNQQLLNIADKEYPLVLMDRSLLHTYIKSVLVDNYPGMCSLVQSLCDKGYKRFAYVGGSEHSLDNQERYAALVDTLKNNGLDFNERNNYRSVDYREKSGYQAAKLMLLGKTLPQVLVCASDTLAWGALKACREFGVSVPGDVSVTGFDNSDFASMTGLTTVAIPRFECGFLAAKALLDSINGNLDNETARISTSIKWRSSTLAE